MLIQTGAHASSHVIPGVLISSPGSGPVVGSASPEQAAKNMKRLATDVRKLWADRLLQHNEGNITVTVEPIEDHNEMEAALRMGGDVAVEKGYSPDHDGRFPFRMTINGKRHVVEMPGLPLRLVRFVQTDEPNPRIMDFPRLFINGSSWIWPIGVSVLLDEGEYGAYEEDACTD